MQLTNHPDKHLTYCTNIHPGESWEEVYSQLNKALPELKQRISPDDPFGIGLRLSARAASTLLKENHLHNFKQWLQENHLYVFTMNGFPYGDFHDKRVKENVYAPDWRTDDRLNYTADLIDILASLIPEGTEGSISTSPISYKYWLKEPAAEAETFRQGSQYLAQLAYKMAQIAAEQDKDLHLDLEPEPDCLLENSRETIDFFEQWLLPAGTAYLKDKFGIKSAEGEHILKKHIGVCYDTCHFAVEYEDPSKAIEQFRQAGIRIGKVQISAALKCRFENAGDGQKATDQLKAFEEATYLHQVIERQKDGLLHHYSDLPQALNSFNAQQAEEWRIHYHVPLFVDAFNGLQSTRDDIVRGWEVFKELDDCHHYEIETYTWQVLPDELKQNLIDSIEREFRWVLSLMNEF